MNKQNEIVELIVEKLSYMDAKKTSKQIEIQSNFDSSYNYQILHPF